MSLAPRIVCAAMRNKHSNLIVLGIRHWDSFMRRTVENSKLDWTAAEQGFVDQFGKFYSREEAHKIASLNGQIIRRCGGDDVKLFSENLY